MLFDRHRPHAFREFRGDPSEIDAIAQAQQSALEERAARCDALESYALHLALDRTRVIAVEAWRDAEAYHRDLDAKNQGTGLYTWAGTGGREPTPVEDDSAGFIVIDIFPVWRPLVRPVSAFNLKNGETFNRQPGCISTTVLRGAGVGSIATYARWRTLEDFFAAFEVSTKKKVASTDDINEAAARMTFGFIRPDYHAYDLIAFKGDAL